MMATCLCVAFPAAAQQAEIPSAPQDKQADSIDIVVTGSVYRGEVASGGARIDAHVKDLPLSISVVTDALIQDRQVRNLRELSENVAGVRSRASGSGAFTVDFTIRGLQGGNGSVVAVNGFRFENFSAGFDPQAVERVEFLKGPASVLYGASGALSGLVNIVTKTPRSNDFAVFDVTGGVPGYGRATADINLRLSDTLDSRTNAALTRENVTNAFRDINEQFIAQSFRWHPGGGLTVIAEGNYFHAIQPSREATTYPSLTRFLDFPTDFKLGERWDRNENTGYAGRLDVSWKIAPGLTLRQGISYQDYREDDFDSAFYQDSGDLFLAPNVLNRSARRGLGKTNYLVSQSEFRWTFKLGPTEHKLLGGFEYGRENFGGNCCDGTPIAPLDLSNPVYGAPRPTLPLNQYFRNTIRSKAFYLQDFISIGKFRVLAGLRNDDTASTSGYCDLTVVGCPSDPVVANLGSARKSALSPRLGVAWQPSDRTTLFASWSKSFNPNTSLDRNNQILPPERGIQYEVGLRQELLDPGKLTLSVSAFDLTRRNIADCDPTFPDCSRYIAIGEQRIKGVEAELSGKPTDWLDLLASYAYLDGKVTKSDVATSGIPVGSKLPEAAPHSASLFAKAALTPLGLDRVSVSTGIYYVSARPARDYFSNYFAGPYADPLRELPGSTRVDLGAYWDVSKRLRLQANITNLFDTPVYEPVNLGFARALTRRGTVGARITL
jgi:iron complex outermembrane receptor protein